MGKYQAYSDYKDSGVEWLGNIPGHWELTRIKYITRCLDGARIPLNSLERGDMKGDIPYWGANKVVDHVNGFLFDEDLILLGEDGAPFFDKTKDVAFNVSGKIWPNNHVHVLQPDKKKTEIRFLKYALNCADFHLYISGSTRDKLNQSDMNEIYVRTCGQSELTQIANFLDHETAKIDTLIEKQQQLIKLLKEKRQAVISHAVTKGLNPNAPMHDSGVEWLGEVPAHWVSCTLKCYARVIDCKHITAEFFDEGIPLASISEVKERNVNLTTAKFTNKKYYLELIEGGRKPETGDIIYSRNATVGEAALVTKDMPDFAMGQDVCLIRMGDVILPEYLLYVLKSGVISNQLDLAMVGSTFKRINVDDIRNFYVALPTYEEQVEIVSELTRNLGKYDSLILNAEMTICLMQERRTALILAAVTGKIDVRNWQPPVPTNTDKNPNKEAAA